MRRKLPNRDSPVPEAEARVLDHKKQEERQSC